MPEAQTLLILISVALGLLLLLLLLVLRLFSRLTRLELIISRNPTSSSLSAPTAGDAPSGGTFESFLKEDRSRREMTKAEQFAAYREWRDEKGLNWSNSPDNT